MKKKIVFHDNLGKIPKVVIKEIEVRNIEHFQAQLQFKSVIHKPKKGKGSFKRKPKNLKEEQERY